MKTKIYDKMQIHNYRIYIATASNESFLQPSMYICITSADYSTVTIYNPNQENIF